MNKYIKMILPFVVAGIIAVIPAPSGLSAEAWYYFAIFIGVVVGLILEPVPAALVGLVGVVIVAVLRLVPDAPGKAGSAKGAVSWALSGFSNSVVWLIFVAFMFALGYKKSGLGKRISLVMVKLLGKRTLGLGYAIALSDLILAPFMPSNTARSAGTIYPIVSNIPGLYGSTPENEPRKLGAYIMWTGIAVTSVTSSMFFTGLAPNLLALSIVEKTAKVTISWTEWFINFAPVGILLLLLVPLLTYVIYPPTLKKSEEAPIWAAKQLKELGKVSGNEIKMAILALIALLLWIFAGKFIDATVAALTVLSLMVLLGVVNWDDITGNSAAWNVLVWFATLVALASGLSKVGFLKWFAGIAAGFVEGYGVVTIMIILALVFFVSHYFFASITAHVTALLPIFLTTAMAIPDLPIKPFSIILCLTLGIMGIITPYATGPSPIWYGAGYIKPGAFWRLGAIFGAIFLGALLILGVPWIMYLNS